MYYLIAYIVSILLLLDSGTMITEKSHGHFLTCFFKTASMLFVPCCIVVILIWDRYGNSSFEPLWYFVFLELMILGNGMFSERVMGKAELILTGEVIRLNVLDCIILIVTILLFVICLRLFRKTKEKNEMKIFFGIMLVAGPVVTLILFCFGGSCLLFDKMKPIGIVTLLVEWLILDDYIDNFM